MIKENHDSEMELESTYSVGIVTGYRLVLLMMEKIEELQQIQSLREAGYDEQ